MGFNVRADEQCKQFNAQRALSQCAASGWHQQVIASRKSALRVETFRESPTDRCGRSALVPAWKPATSCLALRGLMRVLPGMRHERAARETAAHAIGMDETRVSSRTRPGFGATASARNGKLKSWYVSGVTVRSHGIVAGCGAGSNARERPWRDGGGSSTIR